jgi:hypothetical protein
MTSENGKKMFFVKAKYAQSVSPLGTFLAGITSTKSGTRISSELTPLSLFLSFFGKYLPFRSKGEILDAQDFSRSLP